MQQSYKISYRRKTITREFRLWLLKRFTVADCSAEWRFLYYILLGNCYDKILGDSLVIPSRLLAEIEGVQWSTNYSGIVFLKRLCLQFPELCLCWSSWSSAGKARTLTFKLPQDVDQALTMELSTLPPESQRVHFLSGCPITRHSRAKLREADRLHVQEIHDPRQHLASEDATLMYNYLNSLNSNHFTKLLSRIETAKEAILLLSSDKQAREFNILEAISCQPQPFYGYSIRSPRLSILGQGLGTLKSSIRKMLTADWVEIDLQNAQLSINARIWNLTGVQAFLETGQSWWTELFNWCRIHPNQEQKELLKKATYTLCFGGSKETVKKILGKVSSRFLKNPFVKELMLGCKKMLEILKSSGGGYDAYGRWIVVNSKVNARSVLAQISQSYEQYLIADIFRLSMESGEFWILLYQSDGLSISFRDASRKRLWLNRIRELVGKRAASLGIATAISW